MSHAVEPAVWFPTIRARTGADVFTQRLCAGLNDRGVRAEITWLPHRTEYLPWKTQVPRAPAWANVAHINTWLHRRFLPALPVVATMHHVVHDAALHPYKSFPQSLYHRLWIKPIESKVMRQASAVVAVSQYTARMTREVFGLRHIEVVHNGIDPDAYVGSAGSPAAERFRLLYVGSWSRRKGIDLLAPIMQSLGDGFELRITGVPKHYLCGPLPTNCILLGSVSEQELRDAYLSSDALLFPSRLEGFGQVAIEAMAYGLPVIATDGSALPEVVDHGVTGVLCAQDDVAAFVEAARSLAANRELWMRMSCAARERVCRDFDASLMVERYISIYKSLI